MKFLADFFTDFFLTNRHGPKLTENDAKDIVETKKIVKTKPEEAIVSDIDHKISTTGNISLEPERSSVSKGLLWYPDARVKKGQKTKGTYPKKYPEGAIIHFTAGRRAYKGNKAYETGEVAMDSGIAENKYTYFIIGMDGTVWQSAPLDKWGYHAGKAYHAGLNTSSVSKHCVGIEICNAGPLENGKSWFKKEFPEDQIRRLEPGEYPNCKNGGQFLKYTEAQEEALFHLLMWLHWNNPDVFKLENVYGHDEVAPTRKSDPGGSLSMSMPDYRKFLVSQAQ